MYPYIRSCSICRGTCANESCHLVLKCNAISVENQFPIIFGSNWSTNHIHTVALEKRNHDGHLAEYGWTEMIDTLNKSTLLGTTYFESLLRVFRWYTRKIQPGWVRIPMKITMHTFSTLKSKPDKRHEGKKIMSTWDSKEMFWNDADYISQWTKWLLFHNKIVPEKKYFPYSSYSSAGFCRSFILGEWVYSYTSVVA